MDDLVTYDAADGVAAITMDDGKANVLSFAMFDQLAAALDRAEAEECAVVLAGRPGRFSGGFDLPVLTGFGPDAPRLLRAGFELSYRMLSFPLPTVVACTGHAYAMGMFTVVSGDYRFGVAGAGHRLTANEVAIGLPLPRAAIEICRQRLTHAHFERAMVLAEVFDTASAVDAGILDRLVGEDELVGAARAKAVELRALDMNAHAATKLRAREAMLARLRECIEADDAEFRTAIEAAR